MMRDLDTIAAAFEAMPDIASVRRVRPDEFISTNAWMVWLAGSWLADHAGTGATIRDAYLDAKARMQVTKAAA